MFRRSLLAAAVAAVVTPVLPALPAAAQEPAGVTAFTLDLMDLVDTTPQGDVRTRETPRQVAYTDVTAGAATPANGVTLTAAGGPALTLAPPAGQQFAAGTSFPVGGTQSATSGVYGGPAICGSGATSTADGTGQATVTEAAYVDGALARLAADVTWQCATNGQWENARSAVRVASEVPYTLVRPRVVGADPRAAIGGTAAFTVRTDNLGTASVTLGTPVLDLTTAGSYAVTTDGCAGRTLAPGEGCDVALVFTPATYGTSSGWHGGLLQVPVTGYPRTPGVAARLGGRVVGQPALPWSLRALPAIDGIAVTTSGHSSDNGGTTEYELVRRPDAAAAWTTLATIPVTGPSHEWLGDVDTSVAPGEYAEYAVRAIGPLGVTPYSAVRTVTRSATVPETGTLDAIVIDSDGRPEPVVLDAADAATFTRTSYDMKAASVTDGSAVVPTPVVDGPGTYQLSSQTLRRDEETCGATGTLTVTTALYDAAARLTSYAAQFSGTCDFAPLSYLVRYRAMQPFRAVDVTPRGSWLLRNGVANDRTFTVTSAGTDPVTLGAATIDGSGAAAFTLLANDCAGQTLARGASCTISVRALRSTTGTSTARLNVVADTARGVRRVALSATSANLPSAPATIEVYRVVGAARIWWSWSPSDGGSPLTEYRLYRSTAGGPWTLRTTVDGPQAPQTMSFEEPIEPGVSYAYAAVAVNGVGESAKRTAAAARAPRGELVFNHAVSEDGARGIYRQNEWATYEVTSGRFEHLVDGGDRFAPAVSPDGLSLVYSAPSADGYGLWTRAFAGGTPRLLTSLAGHEVDPAWSPDGRTIAFTSRVTGVKDSVWTVAANGGTPVRRARLATDPAWQPDSRTIVFADLSSTLRLAKVDGSGTRSVIRGTVNGVEPAVSPDGKWLAFVQWYDAENRWRGTVVPLAGGTPTAYFGAGSTFDLAWRADAKRIYYASQEPLDGTYYIASTGFTAGSTRPFSGFARITDGPYDSGGVYRSLGVHFEAPALVTGRTASFVFDSTLPVAGERTTCALDGGTPVACTSPWTKSGLSGGRHTLVVRSTASGLLETIATHTWTVDATPPAVTLSAPGSAVSLRDTVTASYSASGAASYDVRYRTAPAAAGYSAYVYLPEWQRTALRSVSVTAPPGTEVCVSVRARDAYGNVSAWTADRCAATPYDDAALSASAAWQRVSSAAAYLGTLTSTRTRGASLTKANVTASRVYLVVRRCSGCGSVDVFVGSTLLGRVSLHGTGADRVVLALPKRSAPVTGTLRITTTSTAPVHIDGVAVLRR